MFHHKEQDAHKWTHIKEPVFLNDSIMDVELAINMRIRGGGIEVAKLLEIKNR